MGLLAPIRSFRSKLLVLVVLSSAIASIAVGGTLVLRSYFRQRMLTEVNLTTQAAIVARNCTASLSFANPEDAVEVLKSLESAPEVRAAVLYDANGARFAAYGHEHVEPARLHPRSQRVQRDGSWLMMTQPVQRDQERLGTLVMAYDLSNSLARLRSNVLMTVSIGALAGLAALLIAGRLQRVLAQPVAELADAANTVSRTRNFSVRARKYADDELGELTDTFNQMLGQIQSQTQDIAKANERFRQAVESAPNAMVMVEESGRIVMVNAQTEKLFGYHRDELINQPVEMLVPERFRPGHPKYRFDFFSHPQSRAMGAGRDLFGRRKDGGEIPVEIGLNPIQTDEGLRVLSSIVDITERKRAEQERAALLESERAARGEAERASRMKDEFVATLSHELRTPLTAILGWAQMLRRTGIGTAEAAEGLEVIERNARVQTQIIEDLLDMSRIISGKIRLDVQIVPLAEVIEAAVSTIRPAADAKGIRLQTIIDPHVGPVRGDPNRLQQVVWNLLSNAVKFTPRGGRVQIALERINSHVEIGVSDTGEGISQEFLPHVFERFRQADATTTRRHTGLGLGLAIVKQLVELHGGTVRVKSPGPGQGSTFTVHLPLTIVHDTDATTPREHPRVSRGPTSDQACLELAGVRVLVVDDEPDARLLIRRVLENCHAVVTTAASASEATQLLSETRFDVLVSDIGMPGQDGYQLIRNVRTLSAAEGGHTPAVALTAFARSEDRTRALLAGYHMHVAKPVEPAELIAIIASLSGRTRMNLDEVSSSAAARQAEPRTLS